MTFEADQIVDRRRLRRKLSFWRVVAFLVLILAIVGGYALYAGRDAIPEFASPQIARVTLSGFITDDRERDERPHGAVDPEQPVEPLLERAVRPGFRWVLCRG